MVRNIAVKNKQIVVSVCLCGVYGTVNSVMSISNMENTNGIALDGSEFRRILSDVLKLREIGLSLDDLSEIYGIFSYGIKLGSRNFDLMSKRRSAQNTVRVVKIFVFTDFICL